jgi:hypothetical protein
VSAEQVDTDPSMIRAAGQVVRGLSDDMGTSTSPVPEDDVLLGGSPPARMLAARYKDLAGATGFAGAHRVIATRYAELGDALHATADTYESVDGEGRHRFGGSS